MVRWGRDIRCQRKCRRRESCRGQPRFTFDLVEAAGERIADPRQQFQKGFGHILVRGFAPGMKPIDQAPNTA